MCLQILGTVMVAALAGAGFYFGTTCRRTVFDLVTIPLRN
jgi:hypothetical protein